MPLEPVLLLFSFQPLSPNNIHSTSAAMPVTHADLMPSPRSTELGSKTGAFLIVLSILFGVSSFILSLIAEATRSEVTWAKEGGRYECTYTGSGKTPLLCAAAAFLTLAIGMVIQHTYLLVAVSKSPPPALVTWDPDSDVAKSLTWQAGFFFVTSWVSFAIGQILLLIGFSIESGHLKNWTTPNSSCLIVRQGLFSTAGVFGLFTVLFAAGLYVTALRAQNLMQEQENVRREVLETSALYVSPPRSPGNRLTAIASQNPIIRQEQNGHSLAHYLEAFDKHSSLV